MTVYKYYLKSFYKQRVFFLVWFGIFLIITFLSAGFPSIDNESFSPAKARIAISRDMNVKSISEFKKSFNNDFTFIEIDNSETAAKEAVFLNSAKLAIINKDKKLFIFSNPAEVNSYFLKEKIKSYMDFINITKDSSEDNIELALNLSKSDIAIKMLKDADEEANKKDYISIWYYFTFRFLAYPLMAIVMGIVGVGILSIESESNLRRSKVSSMSNLKLNLQGFLAEIITSLIIAVIAFLIILLLGGISEVNYAGYIMNIIAFSLSSLGIIFLLIRISSKKTFVTSISNILPLCLSFISGVFVPSEFLPNIALIISRFFPFFYYVQANNEVSKGISKSYFIYISIQILFALCFFLSGVLIDKIKTSNKTS